VKLTYRAIAAALLATFVTARAAAADSQALDLPTFAKPQQVLWPDQGWDGHTASWFHHVDQGTQTFGIPYEWFVALEQPPVSLHSSGLLSNSDYLDRHGFIPDDDPSKLPIGFAHGGVMQDGHGGLWTNPATGKPMTSIGLTCAACHTGRLVYNGAEIRIDGASANTNLKLFQQHLGVSLAETLVLPLRRHRFEGRVLGSGASIGARLALVAQLAGVVERLKHVKSLEAQVAGQSVEEGYGRLDALNRIGNTVFSLDLGIDANYAAESAPVHFPRIWDVPWFLWVQYDGSIERPIVRNAGEALGVSAPVNLTGNPDTRFQSGVQVGALYAIENSLAGPPPNAITGFTGLKSPRWDDPKLRNVLPPINTEWAAKGRQLYASHCQGCHLAPTTSPAFWASPSWKLVNGQRYLDLKLISDVGTDPGQAAGLAGRKVSLPAGLGISDPDCPASGNAGSPAEVTSDRPFGPALGDLVQKVVDKWYDTQQPPTSAADRDRMNGNRPNCIRAPLAYKARPLDGIWATPPYLHNGSVPSLYDLLSPVNERSKPFFPGHRDYDPHNVGLATGQAPGLSALDRTRSGNLDTGHEFSNKRGPGVIGPFFTPEQRHELVEYLKTL
jgi:hypothetical protein